MWRDAKINQTRSVLETRESSFSLEGTKANKPVFQKQAFYFVQASSFSITQVIQEDVDSWRVTLEGIDGDTPAIRQAISDPGALVHLCISLRVCKPILFHESKNKQPLHAAKQYELKAWSEALGRMKC